MNHPSARTIKRVFLFCLIFLPLQYLVVGIVGYYSSEPWPAFVFPGFKNIYVHHNSYQINEFLIEVESAEVTYEFTPQEFFYEIPASQVAGFLRSNFQTKDNFKAFNTEALDWLEIRAIELTGKPVNDLYYIHRRRYLSKKSDVLNTDSVKILNKIKIEEGSI